MVTTSNFFKSLVKKVPPPHEGINLVDFLQQNHKNIAIDQLLIISLSISHILFALSKENIVHGLIRCKSFIVSPLTRSGHTIRLIELPSQSNGNIKDRFWFPPDHPTLSTDIFAFGTTLWEIFSFGQKPKGFHVDQLLCPPNCPTSVWKLIQKCWSKRHGERPKPVELCQSLEKISSKPSPPDYFNSKESDLKDKSTHSKFLDKLTTNYEVKSEYDYKLEHDDNYSFNYEHDTDLPWIILANHIQISTYNGREAILGIGAYGEVLKARYPADSDNFVAVKRINRRVKERNGERIITDVEREFQIMTKVFHPNIVDIIGIVKDPEIMLIMEFMELGSLAKFLPKLKPNELKLIPFQKYAHDIVSGMEYLDKMRIVHRDLAARNILMASTDTVKISDFGLAQSLGPGEDVYFVKTPRYVPFKWYAPESLKNNPIFSHKSDVWSFGVTLWELFSIGATPDYPVVDKNSVSDLIKFLEKGGILPKPDKGIAKTDQFWQIMLKCWKINATDRPDFSQLKNEIDQICKEI